MDIREVIEQFIKQRLFTFWIITFDLPVSTFVFVLLQLIFNAPVSASGISILAGHLQSQVPNNLSQVLAPVIGLGFAFFPWANHIARLFYAALNINPATEGTSGMIVDAAKDFSSEEVLAFGAPEVWQDVHRYRVDWTAAFLANIHA